MFKFLVLLLLLTASFGAGYYMGQRPVGSIQQTVTHLSEKLSVSQKTIAELEQSIKNVSRNVLDTTKDIEHDLRRRQGLLDGKSHVVQAKAHVFDRNFGEAAKELGRAEEVLTQAASGDHPDATLRGLANQVHGLRAESGKGQLIQLKALNELQQALDKELNK